MESHFFRSGEAVRGLSAVYWERVRDFWMEVAFVCRYGHQRVQDVLGEARALTPLELALFARALEEHLRVEWEPRQALGLPAGES